MLKRRIKEISETRMRYGYRRTHILLRRDGHAVKPKRIYRLYKDMGQQLRNKTPKRRVKAKLHEDSMPAILINKICSMGFVDDHLATGRKLRILTIIDIFSRFSRAVGSGFNCRGEDGVATLERACNVIGFPKMLHGPFAGGLKSKNSSRRQCEWLADRTENLGSLGSWRALRSGNGRGARTASNSTHR